MNNRCMASDIETIPSDHAVPGNDWQAAICNDLAKIERQQRSIVEKLSVLKKERHALCHVCVHLLVP